MHTRSTNTEFKHVTNRFGTWKKKSDEQCISGNYMCTSIACTMCICTCIRQTQMCVCSSLFVRVGSGLHDPRVVRGITVHTFFQNETYLIQATSFSFYLFHKKVLTFTKFAMSSAHLRHVHRVIFVHFKQYHEQNYQDRH